MGGVFVSYAREDQSFVRRLTDALTARDRASWVDWEGIPPTAEWMTEIRKAIDEADAFVFVISPDSLSSSICRTEIDHAMERGKRLVPVVWRDADAAAPDAIAARNWLFFREDDDFDAAVNALVGALDTDLDWVSNHTRLTVRSAEWERRGRDVSLLLRGADLEQAEAAIAGGVQKEPAPTALQSEYVLASRQAATRRQRGLVTTSIAVAVILGLLGLVAYTQRNIARRQRDSAISRQLIANARTEAEGNPELALLLAKAAVDRDKNPTSMAMLRETAFAVRERHTLIGHDETTNGVAWLPDGKRVVSSSFDGTVRLWDVAKNSSRVVARHEGAVSNFALSPDGARFATVDTHGAARLWPTTGGTARKLPVTGADTVAFSLDNKRIAVSTTDGVLTVWGVAGGSAPEATSLALKEPVDRLAWSPDGAFIGGGTRLGFLLSWKWQSEKDTLVNKVRNLSTDDFAYAFNQTGAGFAYAELDPAHIGRIVLLSAGGARRDIDGHASGVYDIAFSPNGDRIASGSVDTTARVWDLVGVNDPVVLHGTAGAVTRLAFSPDGKSVASVGGDGLVHIWDAAGAGRPIAHPAAGALAPGGNHVDPRIAYGGDDRKVHLWDARTGKETVLEGGDFRTTYPAFSPDGRYVASAGKGKIFVWDLRAGGPPREFTFDEGRDLLTLAFAPDNRHLAASAGIGEPLVKMYDVASGRVLASTKPPSTATLMSFSADNRVLAFGTFDRNLYRWRWQSKAAPVARSGHSAAVGDAQFSPDGDMLATASEDGTIRLWSNAGDGEARILRGHTGAVNKVSWSVDGKWLVSAGQDGTIRVWNVADSGPAVALVRSSGPVRGVRWVPGRGTPRLVYFSDNKVVHALDCDVCVDEDALDDIVKARTTRDFTDDERTTYLEGGS